MKEVYRGHNHVVFCDGESHFLLTNLRPDCYQPHGVCDCSHAEYGRQARALLKKLGLSQRGGDGSDVFENDAVVAVEAALAAAAQPVRKLR